MKREFVIAGVFLLAVLVLLTGITYIGGKSVDSNHENLSEMDAAPTITAPAPTAVPALAETEKEAVAPETVAAATPETVDNAPIAATSKYWVAGYVTGEDDRVLTGAKVYVHSLDGMPEGMSFSEEEGNIGSAVTDDKGYYTIHLDGPHKIQVRSEPPGGYLTLVEQGEITEEEPNLTEHFVHPLAPFSVRGRVIDAQSKAAIAGAKVVIVMQGRDHHPKQSIERTTSKADGSFEIPRIAQGKFRLEAHAEGYVDFKPYGKNPGDSHPLRDFMVNKRTQDKEYIIEMEPGRAVAFYVVNSEGKPVSKAQIKVTRNTEYFDYIGHSVTGADGSVVNDQLPDEPMLAEASHDKEGKGYSGTFKPGTPDAPEKVVIKLESGASVSGKVVDNEGNTVPGRQVVAEFRSLENWTKYPNESADPSEDGSYSIENLAPGSYQVFLVKKNYYPRRALASQTIELEAGENRTGVDFVLGSDDSTTLKGRVIDEEDKEPVEGVHVFAVVYDKGNILGSEGGQTDENGEFKIFGSQKGGQKIQFSLQDKKGYAHTIHDRPTGEDYYEMTITRSGTIRGVVLDEGNEPVVGAKVYPVRFFGNRPNPMEYFAKSTEEGGAFEFTDLNPQDYSFRASAEGYMMTESDKVSLPKGETIDTVVIHLEKGTEVSGVVIDPQGQPVPGALISIYSNISNTNRNSWSSQFMAQSFPENARTDGAGAFTISDFPPNGDALVVQHEKLAPVKFEITEDMISQSPFTIQMTTGGSIVGKVYDSKNQGRADIQLMVQNYPENLFRYEAHTDDEGNYRFENLAPFSYMVLCNAPIEGPAGPVDSSGATTGSITVSSGGGGGGIGDQQFKTVSVQEGQETQCDFGGGEGSVIQGIVYKRGQIEPGALLELRKRGGGGVSGDSLKTRADAQGAYTFQALTEGTYRLMASDSSAEDISESKCQFSASVEVVADRPEYNVDVYIASIEIQGTVLDSESGEPVSGVQIGAKSGVDLDKNGISYDVLRRLSATTGDDGTFNFSMQEAGDYTFTAIKDGYMVKEFDISAPSGSSGQGAQTIPVEVRMEKDEIGLLVRLIYDDKPASTSWAHIYAGAQRLVVVPQPETGVYRAVGMQEGEAGVKVSAYCNAKVLNTRPQQVTFRRGETAELVLNLFELVDYAITLRAPDNEALKGTATIETLDYPDDPPQQMAVVTEPERGWYNRGMLQLPADVRQVRLTYPGYEPLVFDPKAGAQESLEGEKNIILDLKGTGVGQ